MSYKNFWITCACLNAECKLDYFEVRADIMVESSQNAVDSSRSCYKVYIKLFVFNYVLCYFRDDLLKQLVHVANPSPRLLSDLKFVMSKISEMDEQHESMMSNHPDRNGKHIFVS